MSKRGLIANGLILLAAAGILSACGPHYYSGGTVYKPHHRTAPTGPVQTHTTVVAPHRDQYRYMRYRRDRHGRYHRDRHGHYYMARDGRYFRHRDDRYRRDRHGRYHRDRSGHFYRARDGRYYSARDGRYSRDRDDRDDKDRGGRYGKDRDDRHGKGRHGRYDKDRDDRYDKDRDDRYGKDQRDPGREKSGTPSAAKRQILPGRGLLGSPPGLLHRKTGPGNPAAATARSAKGRTGKSTRYGSQSRQAVKRPPSAVARPAETPKSAPPTPGPRTQTGIFKGEQPD